MSSEWVTVDELLRCGDLQLVQDGNHGGSYPKVDEFVSDGVPLITGACLIDGGVDYSKAGFISQGRAAQLRVGFAKPGDVLLTHKGTMGKTAIVPESRYPLTILNPQITLYRVADSGRLHSRYLKFFFDSRLFQDLLVQISATSTINTLSIKEQKKLKIPVPPQPVQAEIVGVLGALDDRIALLRKTNATLEAIAQALFKSWFVDFDPVRAKQQGLAPEGMDEATAALFPDGFEGTELGAVPKGWSPARLDMILELAYGKALKAEARKPGNIPVYGSGGITGWHDSPLVTQPSIVVGRKGTVGSLYWERRSFFPIDTVFYVKTDRPLTYCYHLLQTLGLSGMNTDAAVPGLNRENVYRLKVPGAATAVVNAFDRLVSDLRRSIDHNTDQAQTLASIRDTLLPRLISGQLRLPDDTLVEPDAILEEIA